MPRGKKFQAPMAPRDGDYGARKQLMDLQGAVPIPNATGGRPPEGATPVQPQVPQGEPAAPPVDAREAMLNMDTSGFDLFQPTARPNEPVTAGLGLPLFSSENAVVPGMTQNTTADTLAVYRAAYQKYPHPALADMIEKITFMLGQGV